MCGIIGYTGARICKPFLIGGLERLEYRGYDSAGISLIEGDEVEVVRAVGNLSVLKQVAGRTARPPRPASGTRAGRRTGARPRPTRTRSRGCDDRFSVVLNGIVENYVVLKQRLLADGHTFSSETDAEVVAHLLETHYDGDLVEAVRLTFLDLHGHFAFCVVSPLHPQMIVGARLQCPMVDRPGRGRDVPRLRRRRVPRAHARGQARRRPRARRDHARGRSAARPRRRRHRARRRDRHVGLRRRREGRLRDVHAQGDPRAARRAARDHRRAARGRRGRARHRPHRRAAARASTASRSRPAAPPATPAWSAAS